MSNYWPWWAGALALAFVTINFTLTTDRSFGVSSAWDRVLHWRRERNLDRQQEEVVDERVLVHALATATAQQFGTPGVAPESPTAEVQPSTQAVRQSTPRRSPLVTQAALLLSIFIGGLIAAVTAGRFELRLDMGAAFSQIVTDNPTAMIGTLFVGGVLVGFGTRLAGGCSSGHGLHGCGRLYPVSLVATAVFFGTAVVVSLLLWKVI